MKQSAQIIATTHIDLHGEKMTVSALEDIVNQVNMYSIPLGTEHDPRIPPYGRIESAKIIKLDDGEYAVEAVFEIFEHVDDFKLSKPSKELPPRNSDLAEFHLVYDRNFRDDEDHVLINDISELFGTDSREELKKAFEPLTVLTIIASFVIVGIARGFLNKLGEDGYLLLKDLLKKLMGRKKEGEVEKLLQFQLVIHLDQQAIEVDVILTNPSNYDIDKFFDTEFKKLDQLIFLYSNSDIGLRRLIFEYKNGALGLSFALRKDGVPLDTHTEILKDDQESG